MEAFLFKDRVYYFENIFDRHVRENLTTDWIRNNFFIYAQLGNKLASELNSTERKKLGYDLGEFMLSCTFTSSPCNMSEFSWFYHPSFGNCYQFNSGFDSANMAIPLKTINVGSFLESLKMDLFFGTPDDLQPMSNGDGMIILIHNASTSPINVNPIFLTGGLLADIQVSRSFTNKLPQPYSECNLSRGKAFDSDLYDLIADTGFDYTQLDCFVQCFQKLLIQNCGCSFPGLTSLLNSSEECLSQTKVKCAMDFYRSFSYESLQKNCNPLCPLECEWEKFVYFMSNMGYPSKLSLEIYSFLAKDVYSNETFSSSLKSNMASVNIYYDKLSYTLIEETPTMDLVALLSSIGGALGLALGVSVLSFVEILEAFIEMGVAILNFKKSNTKVETIG
jgi:hypothetical protein